MSQRIKQSVIAVSLLMPSTVALTETITLKNGTTIKGSIVQMTEVDVTIDTADMGQIVLKRRAIQSINDGVIEAAPAGAQPQMQPGAQPQALVVNNNNNNNNNNQQQQPAATTQSPAAGQSNVPTIVAAPASDSHSVESSVAYVAGRSEFHYGANGYSGPTTKSVEYSGIHVEALSLGLSNGLTFRVAGELLLPTHQDWMLNTKQVALGIGWGTAMPEPGRSGGRFVASLTGGASQVEYHRMESDYYSDSSAVPQVPSTNDQVPSSESYMTNTGYVVGTQKSHKTPFTPTAGVDAHYTYYSSGGAGLTIGAMGQYAEYRDLSLNEDTQESARSITKLAYAGIGVRF